MKTLILILSLILLTVVTVTPATADEYVLGFFADYNTTSCEIYNLTPEIITIHMLVYGSAQTANTAAFYAPTPACWNAVWLGDEINDDYLFLGSSHSEEYGLAVTFKGCKDLPVRLGSMSFFASGSSPCCTYEAYPLPRTHTGVIEIVTCGDPVGEIVGAANESVVINPNASCSCTASSVVSIEETTWGQIKALYQ